MLFRETRFSFAMARMYPTFLCIVFGGNLFQCAGYFQTHPSLRARERSKMTTLATENVPRRGSPGRTERNPQQWRREGIKYRTEPPLTGHGAHFPLASYIIGALEHRSFILHSPLHPLLLLQACILFSPSVH